MKRRYGLWLGPIDSRQALIEEPTVYCVDIEPAAIGATIWLFIDGEQFDWWPKIGTWERAVEAAARI